MDDQATHPTVFEIEDQQVGALYSKALLQSAGDRVDSIVRELEAVVSECLDRFPKLEMALASPRISEEEKQALIDRVFGGKVDSLLLNFLKVLARRRRRGSLRTIQRAASILRDEQLGRLRVIVSTAQKLTEQQKNDVVAKIQTTFGKEAVLVEKIDPALLGGIVLRIGDHVYDGSVLGKMQTMRRAVVGGVQRAIRDRFEALLS